MKVKQVLVDEEWEIIDGKKKTHGSATYILL